VSDPMTLTRWQRAWTALGARGGDSLHAELLARYAEPHRAYHSQQHLAECLALFDEFRHLAERPAEIEIALWFHDAIYDVHRHDNEVRSADWARDALLHAGAAVDAAGRVHALVLATRHSAAPATPDEQLLVDIDLAILGAAPTRFAEYEAQIRVEYAHVPVAVFNEKRGAILAGFLARPVLYATEALRMRCGALARQNLQRALGSLGGGS
jgi:predicted metal-dependent HD superfamily phosphohydrolase